PPRTLTSPFTDSTLIGAITLSIRTDWFVPSTSTAMRTGTSISYCTSRPRSVSTLIMPSVRSTSTSIRSCGREAARIRTCSRSQPRTIVAPLRFSTTRTLSPSAGKIVSIRCGAPASSSALAMRSSSISGAASRDGGCVLQQLALLVQRVLVVARQVRIRRIRLECRLRLDECLLDDQQVATQHGDSRPVELALAGCEHGLQLREIGVCAARGHGHDRAGGPDRRRCHRVSAPEHPRTPARGEDENDGSGGKLRDREAQAAPAPPASAHPPALGGQRHHQLPLALDARGDGGPQVRGRLDRGQRVRLCDDRPELIERSPALV